VSRGKPEPREPLGLWWPRLQSGRQFRINADFAPTEVGATGVNGNPGGPGLGLPPGREGS
jgi:hypothetical protein